MALGKKNALQRNLEKKNAVLALTQVGKKRKKRSRSRKEGKEKTKKGRNSSYLGLGPEFILPL